MRCLQVETSLRVTVIILHPLRSIFSFFQKLTSYILSSLTSVPIDQQSNNGDLLLGLTFTICNSNCIVRARFFIGVILRELKCVPFGGTCSSHGIWFGLAILSSYFSLSSITLVMQVNQLALMYEIEPLNDVSYHMWKRSVSFLVILIKISYDTTTYRPSGDNFAYQKLKVKWEEDNDITTAALSAYAG